MAGRNGKTTHIKPKLRHNRITPRQPHPLANNERYLMAYGQIARNKMNQTITILQHNISYWYDNGQDMPEHEQEHVQQMIIAGYSSGELNDSTEEKDNRGWWTIIKGATQ